MKLKTLKDLELMKGWQSTLKDNEMFIKKRLKEEAIKWIKKYEKDRRGHDAESHVVTGIDSMNRWIKHFFNITKEDLT